ncbi:hypothetical protein DRP05_12755 [Archaeoglobales archaeon]|nr:MAG: hypothetical protein DRP05_12755 [Archaeoglobales archaeon]
MKSWRKWKKVTEEKIWFDLAYEFRIPKVSLLKEMLTEIEALEWMVYFKKRAEEIEKMHEGSVQPTKREHLFVFR